MKKILLLATVLIFSCTKSDLDEINSENKKLNAENKKTNPIDSGKTKTNTIDSDNNIMTDGILFDQSTFEKNRKLWSEQKIANYEFSYHETWYSKPTPPVNVTVKYGLFAKNATTNSSNYWRLKKIDEIYNDIKKKAADNKEKAKYRDDGVYTITVNYDNTYHYPTKVVYGFRTTDRISLPGASSSLTISDFKIKKSNPRKNMIDGIIFDQSTFEKNRKLWREQKITNYECSYYRHSNSSPMSPVTLIVKNGKINGIRNGNTIEKVEKYSNNWVFKTIDEVYNYIEECATADKKRAKSRKDGVYTISVSYDSTYHYPTSVDCDFESENFIQVPGGDTSITIKDFKIK